MKLINKEYIKSNPYKDIKPKGIMDFINEDPTLQEKSIYPDASPEDYETPEFDAIVNLQQMLQQITEILRNNNYKVDDKATLIGLAEALYLYNKGE